MKMLFDKVNIKDIGEVITGKTPSKSSPESFGDIIPFITPTDYKNYTKYISKTERYLSFEGMKQLKSKVLPKESILVTCIGSDMGKVAKNSQKSITNQQINAVIPNEKIVDSDYLYYYIRFISEKLKILARGGTTMPIINKSTFEQIEIELPVMNVQKKIAKLLSLLDAKLLNISATNDILCEVVTAFYFKLFTNENSELTTIGEYAEKIYSGGTPTTSKVEYWNGSFPWLASGETRNRFVISTDKYITQEGIDSSATKLAVKYDIVMASAGQGFTRGQTSMLLLDSYVNQSVLVIHAETNIMPYLFWNLSNRYEELRAISDSSSIRGSLTTKMISAFQIPRVDKSKLQNFSELAWPIIRKIESNLNETERLTSIRDTLLPKLISGELDISNLKI